MDLLQKNILNIRTNLSHYHTEYVIFMILPIILDQSAYFARQLYCYNFTIRIGGSKSPQPHDSVSIYTLLENERPKESNKIASILCRNLTTFSFDDAIVFCDGCSGQNKNSTIIGRFCYWIQTCSPITVKEIKLIFLSLDAHI